MKVFNRIEDVLELIGEDNPFAGRPYVLGEGHEKPDVVVIKALPSFADMKRNKPFLGEDGVFIRQILMELGLNAYFIAGVPYIPATKSLKSSDAAKFSPYITKTLEALGCKNVLLFGAEAVKMTDEFTIQFSKFGDLTDKKDYTCGDYRFRVFQHPMSLAKNPTTFPEVKDSIERMMYPERFRVLTQDDLLDYQVHTTRGSADRAISQMQEIVACDIETTGLDVYEDKILTVQLSWAEGTGHSFRWSLYSPEEWQAILGGRKLVFQNGSFDVKFLAVNGVDVEIYADTMLMHSLINENAQHNMDYMAQRYLGLDKWGDTINYGSMEDNDMQTLGEYGARDVDITLRLYHHFLPKMKGRRIAVELHKAQNAINRAELRGIRVDRDKAFQFQEEVEKALHDRQLYIEDVHGLKNPNSPQQVAKVLYDDMGLPVQKERGKITTNEAALERLATLGDAAIVRDILEYRQLTRANGSYLRPLLEKTKRDGRYHPDFKLASTETGRLSESLIMLIPRPDNVAGASLGKQYQYRLRELFIPDEGHLMIGADYSGLEISMAAHIAGDSRLIQDIRDGVDIHSTVAVEAFKLDIPLEPASTLKERVSEHHGYERTLSKAGVFAWLYGGDETTVAKNLGIPLDVATNIIRALESLYSGVDSWRKLIHANVQETGFVETPWGRRRNFHFGPSLTAQSREAQLRESTNMPIQGMGSDMMLAAFSDLHRQGVQMLFPFHDAGYAQAPEDDVERTAQLIKSVMESVLPGPVPFRADVKVGLNWGQLG